MPINKMIIYNEGAGRYKYWLIEITQPSPSNIVYFQQICSIYRVVYINFFKFENNRHIWFLKMETTTCINSLHRIMKRKKWTITPVPTKTKYKVIEELEGLDYIGHTELGSIHT